MDARHLGDFDLFAGKRAGAVVSSLPLVLMPLRSVIAVLKGAFQHLAPGGRFYQYTYRPGPPVAMPVLARLNLRAERIGRTFANLPPATVYRIERQR